MDRDRHTDENTPDENEEKTDRRSFLKQAGMIGGGALAAMAGLAASAGAQQDIRLGPEGRMRTIDPGRFPILQRSQGASAEQFAEVFAKLKGNRDEIVMSREVAEAMADMSPTDRVGAVAILELRQRFKGAPNLGENLIVLFSLLGAGMSNIEGIDPRGMGNGCGDGCGNGCGTGCMSPVAAGFICGNGCGNNCMGAEAAGLMCGGGCAATGLREIGFDREGAALEGVRLKGLDMQATAAAMQNAERAFRQVFG